MYTLNEYNCQLCFKALVLLDKKMDMFHLSVAGRESWCKDRYRKPESYETSWRTILCEWISHLLSLIHVYICMLTLHLYIIYCYFKAHHGMNASVKALLSFVCTLITGKLTWLNVIWNMLNCLTDFRFQGLSGHVSISLIVVYIPNDSAFIET